MGNKNTSNNQTNEGERNSSTTNNNNNNNPNDFINLIHNKLTTTCNDSPLHQRVWYERQQLSSGSSNSNANSQRCSLLRQLEQDQQQVQRLARNFETKCDDCNNNNNNSHNNINNNNNNNNNINNNNSNTATSNNKNKTTRFGSNSFRLPNVEKSSLSPLQYVKRKFSMRKQDKECSSRKGVSSFSSSPSPPLSPSAALSSPSSSSPVSPSSSSSSPHSPEFMETCLLNSPTHCTSLNNINNNINSNINNNYMSNNNIDVIEGYLVTGSSAVDHLDYSLLPVLSSYQYKLPYTSRDYTMQTGNIPFYEKEIVAGQDDEWLSRNDGKIKGRDDERHQETNVENVEWMVDTFPVMSSPSWKSKNKIRTNPWIAQSSTATPPSSPDTAHLANPGAAMKNQLLRNRCPLKENQDTVVNDTKKQGSKPKQPSFEGARLDDDLNSEGYYSSSFGSLSVHSADSPGLSPLKAKRLNPEYNDDSGFFSMLNSCTSYQSPEEEEEEEEEEEAEPSQCSESDDSETTTEDGPLARSPSVDEGDMPLPCSRDLIAINKLLRMKEMQKQAPVENLDSQAACGFSGVSECNDDDLEDIFADEMWRNSMSSRSLQRKISFEVENQIFELRHDFYDEVFAESQGQLTMDDPVMFQQQQQHQPEQLIQTSLTHSFSDEASDSEEEEDDDEDDTVVNSNRRCLEDIQTTLETSYMELWIQEKKVREAVDRQREEEKLKKKELKMMREKSLENKKLYLLETLQRLKTCLDQQKTWLQRTYDNILEKKWPVLHQIRG